MSAKIVQFPPLGFRPMNDENAKLVVEGYVADIRMSSGRTYRARWGTVPGWLGDTPARCTAWWPLSGPRKRPVGLFDPVAFRPVQLTFV